MKTYTAKDDIAFSRLLTELESTPEVRILDTCPQHHGNTTFNHCHDVTNICYSIAKFLHLRISLEELVRGAMLHDYYLYDTETMPYTDYQHAILHPKLAAQKAGKLFNLSDKEQQMILCHMWPIPGSPLPRSKEAWLLCLADKICAFREMYLQNNKSSVHVSEVH